MIIPVMAVIIGNLHLGGLNTLFRFFISSFTPSLNSQVLQSAWNGLQVTFGFAILAWSLSLFLGVLLGLLGSYNLCSFFNISPVIATVIRRTLTVPRAIHEVLWGLLILQICGLSPWIALVAMTIPYTAHMARVFSEQIDNISLKELIAIKLTGSRNLESLITAITPKIIPIIATFGFYRLECAVRGATLLGIFGLGGIGTELQLSLMSLQFNQMWTSLWMLFISLFLLEKAIEWIQQPKFYINNTGVYTITFISSLIFSILISLLLLNYLGINFFEGLHFTPIHPPNFYRFIEAFKSLNWVQLILDTLILTFVASCIAIGLPPLIFMNVHSNIGQGIVSIILILLRLMPAPLVIILLLLSTTPSTSVVALALGLQNLGVLGRILRDNINKQGDQLFNSVLSTGATNSNAWLYGRFIQESISYLSYSIYRTDIILRETIVVGAVGGVGLGWQLQESLSSFAWEEVILISIVFVCITLIGESINEQMQKALLGIKRTNQFSMLKI